MPLLSLYRAPSFSCSSFFVHRGLCKNRSIDVHGRTQCLHVNLYGPQLLYSSRKFGQVFLTRTVHARSHTRDFMHCSNQCQPTDTMSVLHLILFLACAWWLHVQQATRCNGEINRAHPRIAPAVSASNSHMDGTSAIFHIP